MTRTIRTIPLTKLIPNTGSWTFEKQHLPKVHPPMRPCPLVEIEKHMRGAIFYAPLRISQISKGNIETVTDETRTAELVVFEFDSSEQNFRSIERFKMSISQAREEYRIFRSFGYQDPFTMELV